MVAAVRLLQIMEKKYVFSFYLGNMACPIREEDALHGPRRFLNFFVFGLDTIVIKKNKSNIIK